MNKKWYQSKTLWYAILTGMAGVISQLLVIYPELGQLATLNAIIVGLLRFVTTKEISGK